MHFVKIMYILIQSFSAASRIAVCRVAHCGAPRITAHRTYTGSCGEKMTGSFLILE